ncbi:MAG: hypothetical protein ABIJ40_03530 [Bacteroidota bacterium]
MKNETSTAHELGNNANLLLCPVLTWEHLSIYLPYGLEVMVDWKMIGINNSSASIFNISENGFDRHFNYAMQKGVCKIFGLRPISELTRDEAYSLVNDPMKFKFWYSKDNMGGYIYFEGYSSREYRDMTKLAYPMVRQLAKWKFDFLGLIDKGYAVNINDVV